MKKLLFGLLFLMIASSAWGTTYATNPPDGWKIHSMVMTTAETVYTLVLTTDAYSYVANTYGTVESTLTRTGGAVVDYLLIARLGDIKWLENSLATSEYTTIKQDVAEFPDMPMNWAKNTKWYFMSVTNNVTLEAKVWHY